MDRCDGSLRVCQRLVALKESTPDRVFLILGNRDLNKFRLTAEVDGDEGRPIEDIPGPFWDPAAPTFRQWLEALAAERQGGNAEELNTRAERLRYLLKHTLGCPQTFELRRQELRLLDPAQPELTDDQLVDSFLSDVLPGGILRRYTELADIVAVVGNTVFVHGALHRDNIAVVPDEASRFADFGTTPQPFHTVEGGLHAWAAAMNALVRTGLESHARMPGWDSERQQRGGELLFALQNRDSMTGRCVVSDNYCDGGTMPPAKHVEDRRADWARRAQEDPAFSPMSARVELRASGWSADPFDPEVASWLCASGIRRVVVGHRPTGDSPAVFGHQYTGVEIISADTSYADPGSSSGRGVSIAGVSIHGTSLINHARVFGVLKDGREHEARLPILSSAGGPGEGGDQMVGCELEGSWWCKARVIEADGSISYRCTRGEGRHVEHRDVKDPILV
mmetsp:Transcript_38870/g.77766  ORF Transcript_38870/g.77766 Transcript_38870/m.77766 type:complete len:451 (-) Transcript_38870:234-1586(-)